MEAYSGMLRHQKFMRWWSKQIDMNTAFKLGAGGFSVRGLGFGLGWTPRGL